MPLFKCKMCGGTLEINENQTIATCEYCGTQQTLPKLDSDRRANLYDRANHFRRNNEYDKAMGIYEQILNEDSTDAEAYWSLVLCRYGIEYVEDPSTHKRVPTVNRAQFTSIFDDADYQSALQYADGHQRTIYEEEAKTINDIQKGILAISQKEEPFDVFICYKETDNNGRRTQDSVLANDLYHQLTQEGFKVFFSRITLEDKLGTAYEPYIFAALNSAKVMVVLGTRPEYFNAVWVKNEWSRFLSLIKSGAKKVLIPAYRDMDPCDLPEEFSHLQAQDMSKLGFMQDLIRGIKKLTKADTPQSAGKETVIVNSAGEADPLLRRAYLFLEDGDFASADEYFEKVLDLDPENARAYVGKMLVEHQLHAEKEIGNLPERIDKEPNFQKALRFADKKYKEVLLGYDTEIKESLYQFALSKKQAADNEAACLAASSLFDDISDYKDAAEQAENCKTKVLELKYNEAFSRKEQAKNDADYNKAAGLFKEIKSYHDAAYQAAECERLAKEWKQENDYQRLIEWKNRVSGWDDVSETDWLKTADDFQKLNGYKDAAAQEQECRERAEAARRETERKQKEKKIENAKKRKHNIKVAIIGTSILAVFVAFIVVLTEVIIPNAKYSQAMKLYEQGKYEQAAEKFYLVKNYKDAKERSFQIWGEITEQKTISVSNSHTVGLKADGTVVAVGYNRYGKCNVDSWTDIIAVSASDYHTVGLKADGTVVAVGDNSYGQCDVDGWTDIVAVSAGNVHTVGLKADGTVVAVGDNSYGKCDVDGWTDIIAVSAGFGHTVGLKADGTVVAVGYNRYGKCDVDGWTNIVAVSANDYHTVGLKADGTAVAVGDNSYGKCDVDGWTDIVAVSAGDVHTVGLKADGTVVAVGDNSYGQCDVEDWTDIVAVSAGNVHTVGLKADGTVVAVGDNSYGQCDVEDWTDIKVPGK